MRKRTWTVGVACAVLVVTGIGGLAACSSGGGATSSGAAEPAVAPGFGTKAAPNGTNAGSGLASGGAAAAGVATPGATTPSTLTPEDVTRSVIRDGTITVRVSDVNTAAQSATALATGAGGYVGADDRTLDGSHSTATVTLRVPADRFDATMTALSQLGTESSRHVSTEDVTEQVVDVQSRLATQQASVNRIRQLLASTTSISQIVSLEDELTQRESDLESMEAQLRSLTGLASLSTVTAVLIGPAAQTPAPAKKEGGFVGGLKAGWHGFLTALGAVATVIGAVLPFLIVLLVIVAVWLPIRRRSRRLRRSASAPSGPEVSD